MPDEITFNFEANVPFIDFALCSSVAHLQWNEFNEMIIKKRRSKIASQTIIESGCRVWVFIGAV